MKINNEIIDFVKTKYIKETADIRDSLILLNSAIEEIVEKISSNIVKLSKNRDFNTISYYTNNAQYLDSISQNLQKYIAQLEIKESEEVIEYLKEEQEIDDELIEEENIEFTDTEIYNKNNTGHEQLTYIPLEQETNFTYQKPLFFEFKNKIIKVRSWKEILLNLCIFLYKENPEIILGFPSNPQMKRKKKSYFSGTKEGMFRPKLLNKTNLYIATNLSANDIAKLIRKILKQYNISASDLKVYLRPPNN